MAGYLLAIGVTLTAVALRWLLHPWLGDHLALVTLFAGVAATQWLAGSRPAVLAAALGYVLSNFLFIGRIAALDFDPGTLVGLAAYGLSTGIIVAFGRAAQAARERAASREALLRVTLASIGDAVITTDTGGRVTSLNAVAESLTGWPRSDAIGQPVDTVFRIVSEQTRAPAENPVARVFREGVVIGLANHTVLIAKDGAERPIDDSAAPIRDDKGEVAGCVLVFRDVTHARRAERALEASERELADFFENASIAFHWAGPDGVILRANQAELDLLGYTRDEYVGRHVSEFHVDPDAVESILGRLASGETLRNHPARLRCKDGTIRDVLISSSVRFEDGRYVHTRCFTVDVTGRRQAEEARALLANIVAASDDAIVSKTLEGTILTWNAGAERIFGYTPEEAVGRSIDLIIPPELRAEERSILQRLRAGERIDHFETVRVTKDGRRIDISLTISPVRNDDGRIVGASTVARDITERKRAAKALRESEERFARFMQHLPGLAWIKDLQGRYVLVNDAAEAAFGIRRDDLYGRSDAEVFPPDLAARFAENDQQALASDSGVQVIETLEHPDGLEHHSIVSKFPIYGSDGRAKWIGGMAIDVTERRRAEQALREADRRKDEFLATLAHELRNPLAPFRHSLEILKRTDSTALLRQARDTMERQLAHLVRLVDELLDVSRITRDHVDLRRLVLDLDAVLMQAVETAAPTADRKGQTVTIVPGDGPVHVNGDPVRLSQIFSNLLDNALKYTPEGGRVTVRARRIDGDVEVSVADNGVGIPPDKLESIFEMFAQVDPALDRPSGGLGIGLTLVRRLVELHDGTVEARSGGVGQGSEFLVRLPAVAAPAPSRDEPPAATPESAVPPLRVLVVDDNEDSAESLAMLLGLSGHRAELATDGLAAIEAAERFRPEVVLLDLGLPKMNGYDVCRRLREQSWARRVVIVALTGWGQEEDRRRSKAAGFDGHLVKPVEYAELLQLLSATGRAGDADRTTAC